MLSLPSQLPRKIYLAGLAIVAIGMPVSVFLMSIGQFIVLAGILLDGHYSERIERFWKNKMAVLVSSVLLFHLLGLFYTTDFDYGLKDIRIKAPLFLLPLFVASSEPLSKKSFNWLLAVFVGAVTVGTWISMGVYYGLIPTRHPVVDTRGISIFISHIRFSMMIAFSVFISAYYFYHETFVLKKIVYASVIIWLIVFLIILNALTGIMTFVAVIFILMLYGIFTLKSSVLRISSLLSFLVLITGLFFYVRTLLKEADFDQVVTVPVDLSKLESRTALGNPYVNDTLNAATENGNRLWIYVCEPELRQAWNERSAVDFEGRNKKGDFVKYTLIRYLASKGLRKDAAAVQSLSKEEIKSIEKGVGNVNYIGKPRLTVRLMETFWEFKGYLMGASPNGHSTVMRLEFWRAALGIIQAHPILGVGTGDVKDAFDRQYQQINSSLDLPHRLRSHNQFLSITVAFGFIGLLWFLTALIYPMVKMKKIFDYFYAVFFIIFFLSLFMEDTLESQAGVTFYAFFNAILLFARPSSGPQLRQD